MKTYKRNKNIKGKLGKRSKQNGGWPSFSGLRNRVNNSFYGLRNNDSVDVLYQCHNSIAEHSDIVALIDVDGTLVRTETDDYNFGKSTIIYNYNLICFLKSNNIKKIYLFTDMHISDIYDREELIKYLKKYDITVLGVIIPTDIIWNIPDEYINDLNTSWNALNETLKLKINNEIYPKLLLNNTPGKLYNDVKFTLSTQLNSLQNNEDFLTNVTTNEDIKNLEIKIRKLKDILTLLNYAKDYTYTDRNTIVPLNRKGPIMDLFISYIQKNVNNPNINWIKSILVIDDNEEVIKSIGIIAKREQNNIIITPILITKDIFKNTPTDIYETYLKEHLEKLNTKINNPLNVNNISYDELNKVTSENASTIKLLRARQDAANKPSWWSRTFGWNRKGGKNRSKKNNMRQKKYKQRRN